MSHDTFLHTRPGYKAGPRYEAEPSARYEAKEIGHNVGTRICGLNSEVQMFCLHEVLIKEDLHTKVFWFFLPCIVAIAGLVSIFHRKETCGYFFFLGVTLEWTEDDYTGTELSRSATGQIFPTNTIANPIMLRITPVTYSQVSSMFPGITPPGDPFEASCKNKVIFLPQISLRFILLRPGKGQEKKKLEASRNHYHSTCWRVFD